MNRLAILNQLELRNLARVSEIPESELSQYVEPVQVLLAKDENLFILDRYHALETLDRVTDCQVSRILHENGEANLTICPTCKVDDFTHVEGCKNDRYH